MRKSRVLLAGVAVAAAAAATSAFTASNTSTVATSDLKAGYGEVVVSGVTVTNVTYNPLAADASKLDSVVFTTSDDVSTQHGALTLKKSGTPVTVIGSYSGCTMGAYTAGAMTITCSATDNPDIDSFDTVGLTVTH
jgi:hypothetical protein